MPVWLQGLLAFFGLAEKVVEEVHDHNQTVAGENVVVAADLKQETEFDEKALKAAVDDSGKPLADSLRDGSF